MIPCLPRGVRLHWDKLRETHVLLGPERALMLDQIAYEILRRVDGEKTGDAIFEDLAATFNAPLDQVRTDASALLTDLADKRLLEAKDA